MITQVGVSSNAIINWTNHLRGLVIWDIEDLAAVPIGGEGIIAEIVETTPERRMIAMSVQDRSADTLRDISQEHVLPGTLEWSTRR
jgi:hypothetical protein